MSNTGQETGKGLEGEESVCTDDWVGGGTLEQDQAVVFG